MGLEPQHTCMVPRSSDESSRQVPTKSKDRHASANNTPCNNDLPLTTGMQQRTLISRITDAAPFLSLDREEATHSSH